MWVARGFNKPAHRLAAKAVAGKVFKKPGSKQHRRAAKRHAVGRGCRAFKDC